MLEKRMETYSCGHGCPVEATLDAIGGKWKGLILYHLLSHGTIRFNQFRRLIPAATRKTLTRQLRELEDVGIVNRRAYPGVPLKVEYSLTERGLTLEPIIRLMRDWGESLLSVAGNLQGALPSPNSVTNCDLAPDPRRTPIHPSVELTA